MNDFKGFDLNDPGLQAPSPEERQARATGAEVAAHSGSLAQTAIPARPVFPGAPVVSAGSALPMGSMLPIGTAGVISRRTFESDWPSLVPPPHAPPAPAPPKPALSAVPEPASPSASPSAPLEPAPPAPASLSTAARPQQPTTFQRAVNVFRAAMPLVQRVLPLLDGNVGAAVSNLMAPRPQSAQPSQPVNLVPIETGLAKLQLQQRELRDQVVEQNASLKKVEDQLQQVREATDRNTLEQQELLQDLKTVGTRVNLFAYIALVLLGLSVVLNVVLFVQLRHFLR
jgi:hypothetical protein